jgi:hypothetical protein
MNSQSLHRYLPTSVVNYQQLLLGLICLASGTTVYFVLRSSNYVWFIPDELDISFLASVQASILTGSAPTFFHVAAFSLLTSAVLSCERSAGAQICLIWVLIESVFEFGQHPIIGTWLNGHFGDQLDQMTALSITLAYFINGTFDYFDLVSVVGGAWLAYWLITRTTTRIVLLQGEGVRHEHDIVR